MSPLKIGIAARMWDHPGIGRYIRELSHALIEKAAEEELCFLVGNAEFIRAMRSRDGLPRRRPSFREARSKIYSLTEQWEIPRRAAGLDLLHVPHFNIPVFLDGRLVVTLHDLTYFHDPGVSRWPFAKAYLTWLLKTIQKKAAAVIAVSEYTKKDLLRTFPSFPAERVRVIHEAASPVFRKVEDGGLLAQAKEKYALHNPYVLCVASLKKHKNLPALILALARIRKERGMPHELVLVGRRDPSNPELLDLIRRHPFVRHVEEVNDGELRLLYNLADLFVLPSLREGFGLPVLEAMACGTPVAVSRGTSLPEVAGEAGIFFDPDRIDALEDVLYNVLNDKELRKKLADKGSEQAKKFSWKKTAEETLKVYKQVMA